MSNRIKNLADAGYITKVGLVGNETAEAWSVDDMLENQIITLVGLDPEAVEEIAEGGGDEPSQPAAPIISDMDGENKVTITSSDPETTIEMVYCVLAPGATEPVPEQWKSYKSTPIEIEESCVVFAMSIHEPGGESEVARKEFTIS